MGNCVTDKISHEHVSTKGIKVGVSGMQGWRQEMEDDHIAQDMPSRRDHTFLAVFDGHGGVGAAKYAASNMVEFIEKTGQWKSYVKDGAKDLELLKAALIQAFQDIDESIRAEQEKTGNNSDSSGCTANTVMLTPTAIICANAGDSRCVLSKKSGIEGMSIDHKPYDEKEKARIEAAGGIVHMKRVDGDLAVSRTFGDFAYKQRRDLPASEQKVSAVPDIKVISRDDDDDEFLILACDGLWDVMTNEDAAENVRRLYLNGEQSPVLIAEEMLDIALEKGSRDNISSIIVQLPAVTLGPGGGVKLLREQRADASRAQARLPGSLDGEEHSG